MNFITTGHKKGKEPGLTYLFNGQLQNGYTIRTITHTHPKSNYASDSDFDFAEQISLKVSNNIKFLIYHVPQKEYFRF